MKYKYIYSKELFIKEKNVKGEIEASPSCVLRNGLYYYSPTKSSRVTNAVNELFHAGCEGNTDIHTITFRCFSAWCDLLVSGHIKTQKCPVLLLVQ